MLSSRALKGLSFNLGPCNTWVGPGRGVKEKAQRQRPGELDSIAMTLNLAFPSGQICKMRLLLPPDCRTPKSCCGKDLGNHKALTR